MKTRITSFLLIAAVALTVLFGCSPGVQMQPEGTPAETLLVLEEAVPPETSSVSGSEQPIGSAPSVVSQSFSFWGSQVDIDSLPEYIPHRNVLLSIRNLSEAEKEFYILFAQVYQYLHICWRTLRISKLEHKL